MLYRYKKKGIASLFVATDFILTVQNVINLLKNAEFLLHKSVAVLFSPLKSGTVVLW